jgi:hypothetical protein
LTQTQAPPPKACSFIIYGLYYYYLPNALATSFSIEEKFLQEINLRLAAWCDGSPNRTLPINYNTILKNSYLTVENCSSPRPQSTFHGALHCCFDTALIVSR